MPRLVSLLTGSGMNCAPTGALVTARNHFRFSSFSRQTASSMSCEPATAPTASKLARTPAVCKPCSGRPSLLGSTTQRRFMARTNIPVLATSYCPARLQRIGASQASASTTCCSRRLHTELRLYLALNKSSAITSAFNPPAASCIHEPCQHARKTRPGSQGVGAGSSRRRPGSLRCWPSGPGD